jgi:hypothetical protein
MNFTYPTTEQIPLRGKLEKFCGVASLLEQLSFSGAVGVLKIGQLELHLSGNTITHAVHAGLSGQDAAIAILQRSSGKYSFHAEDPKRTLQLEVSATALLALKNLDEARMARVKISLVVLPNIQIALHYLRGIGGLDGWKARITSVKNRTAIIIERGQWQILALGTTWDDLQGALRSF